MKMSRTLVFVGSMLCSEIFKILRTILIYFIIIIAYVILNLGSSKNYHEVKISRLLKKSLPSIIEFKMVIISIEFKNIYIVNGIAWSKSLGLNIITIIITKIFAERVLHS